MLGWFSSLILRNEIMITGLKNANDWFQVDGLTTSASCPSSNKMGHKTGLSFGGSGSSAGLIMQPAFDVASGDIGLSVS